MLTLTAIAIAVRLLQNPDPANVVSANGTHLEVSGQVLLPRGVNLGNYFVPEPYMMGGGKSNEDLRLKLIALAGGKAPFSAWRRAWLDHFIQKEDIVRIHALGFNTVRVPLDFRDFLDAQKQAYQVGPISDGPLPADAPIGLRYLDRLMTWCAASGVYVLPDMHVTPDTIDNASGNIFVDSPDEVNANLDLVKNAWTTVAMRYRTAPQMLGYDLLNEPRGYTDSKLRPTYLQIRNAIRKVDHDHLIVIEPNVYSDLGDPNQNGGYLGEPIDSKLLLSPHYYGGNVPSSIAADEVDKGRKFLNWEYAKKYGVPILVGETGENDNQWTHEMVRLWSQGRDGISAGTLYWTYKKPGDSVRCVVSVPWVGGWSAIGQYLDKGGALPEDANDTLMKQAEQSGFARETLRRDVLEGLNPAEQTQPLPFTSRPIALPGVIHVAQYDIGGAAPAATSGDAFAYFTHNTTMTYEVRNDRVGTHNAEGGSIGFLGDGDWQRYSVLVAPGTYRVSFRYAAPTSDARITITLDGKPIFESVALPSTGGWDAYHDLVLGKVALSRAGLGTLRITVDKAGLNEASLTFDSAS